MSHGLYLIGMGCLCAAFFFTGLCWNTGEKLRLLRAMMAMTAAARNHSVEAGEAVGRAYLKEMGIS